MENEPLKCGKNVAKHVLGAVKNSCPEAPPTHRNFYTETVLHREAFTHRKLLHIKAFTNSTLSHTASVYTQNTYTQCFYTWQAFTHTETIRNFYTETVLHTEKLLHTASLYTQNLLHTAGFHTQQAFTHRTLTHSAFTHAKRLHTQTFTHRNCSSKTGARRHNGKNTNFKLF